MGKRSTKTTKTGKFMNPTDQWRKQCRRKELRKNKQQRQTVRDAVLKSKNPWELLEEIEEIEKMEIESGVTEDEGLETPNEKGLKEKKRKLHDTLSRLIKYYDKENPKKAADIKKMVVQSEGRRRDMSKVYSSYRAARSEIDVSDIPLPDTMADPGVVATSDIPMPTDMDPDDEEDLVPPGPPPGPPPEFLDGLIPPGPPPGLPSSAMLPSSSRSSRAVRFSEKDSDDERDSSDSDYDDDDDDSDKEDREDSSRPSRDEEQISMPPPPGPPPGMPPPPGLFSQHTPTPLFAQMPPPPGLPLGVLAMPRQSKFSLHPPSMPPPPAHLLIPPSQPTRGSPHIQSSPIISKGSTKDQTAIISAQPQLRNMQAEVTKFLPTTLRVRREQPKVVKSQPRPATSTVAGSSKGEQKHSVSSGASLVKEDEYKIFMKQMQGLF